MVIFAVSEEKAHATSGPRVLGPIAQMLPGHATQKIGQSFKYIGEMPDGTWYHVGIAELGKAVACPS